MLEFIRASEFLYPSVSIFISLHCSTWARFLTDDFERHETSWNAVYSLEDAREEWDLAVSCGSIKIIGREPGDEHRWGPKEPQLQLLK